MNIRRFGSHFVLSMVVLGWGAAAWAQSPTITVGPDFGTFPVGQIQIPLVATGGSPPYTWSVTAGALPTGLTIRTDNPNPLPGWWPSNAAAEIMGVATTTAYTPSASFTLTVTDSALASSSLACTMKIIPLMVLDQYPLPDAFVNVSYSYTPTTSGASGGVTWALASGNTLPAGLFLNSSTGEIHGTPTAAGNYGFTVGATDSNGTVWKGFGVVVWGVGILTGGNLGNVNVGSTFSAPIVGTGGTGPYTFTGGGFPPGLSLGSAGTLIGTVTGGNGTYRFWIAVTDSTTHASYSKQFTLNVIGSPTLPNLGYPNPADDAAMGEPRSYGFNVNGGRAPYTWSVTGGSLPPGMWFRTTNLSSYLGPNDAEITGTATALGTYSFNVAVMDSSTPAAVTVSQPFTIVVKNTTNDYPPNGVRGTAYNFYLRPIGGSLPCAWSILGGSLPAGLSLDGGAGIVSGTPTENGNFYVVVGIAPTGAQSITNTIGFNINSPTNPQIAMNGTLPDAIAGAGYGFQLNACCAAGSVTYSIASGSLPSGTGLSATGLISGTPSPAGTYTFEVHAIDGADSSNYGVRVFTLNVSPIHPNTPTPTGTAGSGYSTTFTATGCSGSCTWTLGPGQFPPGVSLQSNGTLSGTLSTPGSFGFNYTVKDGSGNSYTGYASVQVYASGSYLAPWITSGVGTWSVGEVQSSLSASGGNGTYSWSVAYGSLPLGISLRTDMPGWFPSSSSAGLIGVATTSGTYTFTLAVTSAGQTAYQYCTVRISPLVVKDLYSLPDAFLNTLYPAYTLTAMGNAGTVHWTATSGMPPGMSLSDAGVLSGTPTSAGFYNINLMLTDGVDTVYRGINLNVSTIQITSPGLLPNATYNSPYTPYTFTASGGTGPYTWTSNSLPNGLALNSSTGVLSGTPTWSAGRWAFNLTATDTNHVSYTKNLTIVVIGVLPTLPTLLPYSSYGSFDDCTIGVPCSRGISESLGGTAPFTWAVTGLPPGMDFRSGSGVTSTNIWPTDVELWGTPTATGTYQVQAVLTDFNGVTVTQTFPLRFSVLMIDGQDNLPGGTRGVPYSKVLRVLGGTGPYTATLIANALPANVSLTGMTVSGTPAENGSFSPEFWLADSAGHTLQSTQYFSIGGGTSTLNINQTYNLGTVTVGSSYSNQLSACCASSYTWSVIGGTPPSWLNLSTGGLLSGTAAAPVGTYTFLVQVADGSNPSNTGVRQFVLTVTPISVSTSSALPYGNVGVPYSQTLTASGGTGTLTWAGRCCLPPNLFLNGATGAITGTPTSTGYYAFTVTVTDSATPHNVYTRTFSISIYAAGAAPPVYLGTGPNLGPYQVGVIRITLSASSGVPPYHYSLTPLATPIAGMRVIDGPRMNVNPPDTSGGYYGVITASGVYTTSIRVTDSAATPTTFDRIINITVSPLAILSAGSLPKATSGVPYASFTFTGSGGDGNYSWSATNVPSGMSLNSAGVLSGTPIVGASGSGTINVTLADPGYPSVTTGYTMVVDPFAITTGAVLTPGTVGKSYSQQLSAPNCTGTCTWSMAGGSTPGGISLNSAGVLSGTTTYPASNSFTVQVTGSNGTVQKVFSLFIANAGAQPLFISSSTALPYITVGGSVGIALIAAGGTSPYTWSLDSGSLPSGVSLQQGPGETLASNFVPGSSYLWGRALQSGDFNFRVRVTDHAGASMTQALTLHITVLAFDFTSFPVTGTPVGGPVNLPTYNVAGYSQKQVVLGGSGVYPTWSANGAMPAGLGLNTTTGTVSGTPGVTGSISTPIQVVDGAGNTMVQNITFNIASPTGTSLNINLGPDLGTVAEGFPISWNLNPSGGTGPYTFRALTALPPGFVIETGTARYNGAPTYPLAGTPLASGLFTFMLEVQDSASPSHNVGARTFTLRITPFTPFLNTSLADASVGTPYSETLHAFGGSGTVNWTLDPASALPPGLYLVGNTITGTPTVAGDYTFVLPAADSSGFSLNWTFTLHVSTITITDPRILLQQAIVGVPFSYTFTATGGGPTKTWSASGLPHGLGMSPTTGTISGTPSSNTGSFGISVTVTDGASPVTRLFTLFVRYSDPTVLDSNQTKTVLNDALVGQSYVRTLGLSGGIPPYSWSVASGSSLPTGISLYDSSALGQTWSPGTWALAGAPTTPGSYTFDLVATDSVGTQVRRTFTLKVSPMGLQTSQLRNPTINTSYDMQLTAVGGTPPYSFTYLMSGPTLPLFPPGVTASPSGEISGTPTSTGNYDFIVTVQDSSLPPNTFRTEYTWSVQNSHGLYVTTPDLWDQPVGVPVAMPLTTNGASTYTWSVVAPSTLPPGMVLAPAAWFEGNSSQIMLTGSPQAPGIYTFTLRATDNANGSNQADRLFTYHVGPAQPLYQLNYLPPAHLNVPYSFTFRMAGGTPPYTFTAPPETWVHLLPQGLSITSDGKLTGTPQQTGTFYVVPYIQDGSGTTIFAAPWYLNVLGPGAVNPIVAEAGGAGVANGPEAVLRLTPEDVSLGTPTVYRLDTSAEGGVPPYTWAVSGTAPPGMVILPGSGAISAYAGGIATTPGTYNWNFVGTDASGQTVTAQAQATVTPLSLAPLVLPPGMVGTPYAATLTPSGGTPPYTVQVATWSGCPPGLSLGSAGAFSGTPQSAGVFYLAVTVTDSASPSQFSLTRNYLITIDNAIGQAPALSLSPASVQVNYTRTASAPPPVPIVIGTTSGSYAFTAMVSGIPGATLSSISGTTLPATVNLNLNTAALSAGTGTLTYAGVIAVNAPLSANGNTAIPVVVTVTDPPPCSYSLSPNSGSVPTGGGTGSFGVSAGSLCAWSATTTDSWITVTAGAGPGGGPVSYSVAANPPGQDARTGHISVAGQSYTIAQFGSTCTLAISPPSVNEPAVGGAVTVNVLSSLAGCPWTASGLGATPAGGAGNGSVTVTIPVNNSSSPVGYTATIAGQTLTVSQAAANALPPPCSYSLSPGAGTAPYSGGTGSFNVSVALACAWTPTPSDPSWITVTAGTGPGSTAVSYTVAPSPPGQPARTGSISVADQTYTITQFGSTCSLSISPPGVTATSAGGTATVNISSSLAGCPWTASGLSATPAAGTGNGAVTLTIPVNLTNSPVPYTATIAGQTFTVSQGAANCIYNLGSSAVSLPAGIGTGSVSVGMVTPIGGCTYSTVPGPSWITISSGGSGGTSGTLTYSVAANSTTVARSGSLTIAGQPFQITQEGIACSMSVDASSSGSPFGSAGGGGTISVTANGPNCSWTASSSAAWATVAPTSGMGSGAINVTVASNAGSATARTTNLTIAGQTVGITESGIACTYSLSSATASVPASGGSGSVGVIAPAVCGWGAVSNNTDWLNITSSGSAGSANVLFTAAANTSSSPRTGTLTVAGQTYTVTQAGAPCSYSLPVSSASFDPGGSAGTATFSFTTSASGCSPPSAVSYSGWITVLGTDSGSGTVSYTVAPATASRSGTMQLGDQTFTVTQTGVPCAYSLNAYGAVFNHNGGGSSVYGTGTASCTGPPPVGTSQPSIVSLGTLTVPNWTLPYTVLNFNSTTTAIRRATITFGGQILTVKQTSW